MSSFYECITGLLSIGVFLLVVGVVTQHIIDEMGNNFFWTLIVCINVSKLISQIMVNDNYHVAGGCNFPDERCDHTGEESANHLQCGRDKFATEAATQRDTHLNPVAARAPDANPHEKFINEMSQMEREVLWDEVNEFGYA